MQGGATVLLTKKLALLMIGRFCFQSTVLSTKFASVAYLRPCQTSKTDFFSRKWILQWLKDVRYFLQQSCLIGALTIVTDFSFFAGKRR